MRPFLFIIPIFLSFNLYFCNSPTSSNETIVKVDTLVIKDTVPFVITKHDTIYAPRILSGTSTLIGKTTIDSIWQDYGNFNYFLRIFWSDIPNAIGYRVFLEVPGTGTYEATENPFKTTNPSYPGFWELDFLNFNISQHVSRSMVVNIYVVGVDSKGLDGPVSVAYPYMFYP